MLKNRRPQRLLQRSRGILGLGDKGLGALVPDKSSVECIGGRTHPQVGKANDGRIHAQAGEVNQEFNLGYWNRLELLSPLGVRSRVAVETGGAPCVRLFLRGALCTRHYQKKPMEFGPVRR